MHKSILFFLIVFAGFFAKAQELNCEVTVRADALQITDPAVIQTLEQEITKFMNERVWTDDNFSSDERIKCQLILSITEDPGNDVFKATASTSLSRPVFNADYETTLYGVKDESWNFKYRQFDDMNFNESVYTSELTSLLAFYAYVFIGTYYDSFAPSGGTPYFLKAQTLVNNAQNESASKSWDAFGGKITRYTYIENILNNRYKGMRNVYYEYHRNGLDKMYDDEQATKCKQWTKATNTKKTIHHTSLRNQHISTNIAKSTIVYYIIIRSRTSELLLNGGSAVWLNLFVPLRYTKRISLKHPHRG